MAPAVHSAWTLGLRGMSIGELPEVIWGLRGHDLTLREAPNVPERVAAVKRPSGSGWEEPEGWGWGGTGLSWGFWAPGDPHIWCCSNRQSLLVPEALTWITWREAPTPDRTERAPPPRITRRGAPCPMDHTEGPPPPDPQREPPTPTPERSPPAPWITEGPHPDHTEREPPTPRSHREEPPTPDPTGETPHPRSHGERAPTPGSHGRPPPRITWREAPCPMVTRKGAPHPSHTERSPHPVLQRRPPARITTGGPPPDRTEDPPPQITWKTPTRIAQRPPTRITRRPHTDHTGERGGPRGAVAVEPVRGRPSRAPQSGRVWWGAECEAAWSRRELHVRPRRLLPGREPGLPS